MASSLVVLKPVVALEGRSVVVGEAMLGDEILRVLVLLVSKGAKDDV